ncbi:MAG TPA: AIPR family protein [Ktedonobacterales bacterium]
MDTKYHDRVSPEEWKSSFLQDIDAAPDTTTKGDRFVQQMLCGLFGYSLDDAIDATEHAGAGDHGVDALIISEAEDEGGRTEALVMQGKYGEAGNSLSPYYESRKFVTGLSQALASEEVTPAINRCAKVLQNGGVVRYVIATVEPLSSEQSREVDDIRVLSSQQFGDRLLVETVSLDDLRDALTGSSSNDISVRLKANGVRPTTDTFVGVASLVDVYEMMRQYAVANHNNVDAIYDRNVRKWLKRRSGSVNSDIYRTLDGRPEKFIAFNNGITLVCDSMSVSDGALKLENPYIVNGCQTTRTLYEFIVTKFAGRLNLLATDAQAVAYREAFLTFKVIAHPDDTYRKDITRWSNKQNALRGKDFLSLEDTFRALHQQMQRRNYFLQVQAGEYDALPKHEQVKYPRATHLIDAFDALRYYASAVLSKPNTAFGRSGQFTPEGDEFKRTMDGITVDDLLVPWLMAQEADGLGYSAGAKRTETMQDDHRNQTRYFYLYTLFQIASRVIFDTDFDADAIKRHDLYGALEKLRASRSLIDPEGRKSHAFTYLLQKADQCVRTFMILARQQNWYSDRNAFLKGASLLSQDHYTMATAGPLTDVEELRMACRQIIEA